MLLPRPIWITGDSKTYMGLDKIPLAPTLVICPTTLTSQWKKEFEKCLDGKACRILIYRGNEQERDGFFAEGSEFDKAVKGDHPEHTVVIAEAPVRVCSSSFECLLNLRL